MNTIFLNSKTSKTSDRHRLLLNLTHKLKLEKEVICCSIKSLRILSTKKYKKFI